MNKILEEIEYPLEKLSLNTLDYHIKNDPLLSLKNHTVIPVYVSGRGEIIRDAFVAFSKNIPKESYLVVDFQRNCNKIEEGYEFILTGNAVLLNKN